MIRSFMMMAAVLVASTQANAAWLTQYATVDRGTDGDATFVQTITGTSSDGLSFTNTIDTAAPSQVAGSTARVVSVGANLLSGYVRTVDGPPFQVPTTFDGQRVVAVYALEGTATQIGPGESVAAFDTGRLAFYTVAEGSFNRFNPATWGAYDPVTGLMNTPIAVYDLGSPADVGPGTIDGITPDPDGSFNLSASQVNKSAINALVAVNTQGNFVFTESITYGGPTRSDNFVAVTGPDFTSGGTTEEGLVIRTDQAIVINPATGGGITPARLAGLNLIAQELGGLGGNAAGGFATGLGPAATDYNLTGSPALTGDLRATLGTTMAPVAVPEPASIAVFSLIGVCALPVIRRRRRMQATA